MIETSERSPSPVTNRADSAAAVSRALTALSETELLRLQALARLRARGLPPGVAWTDLLHEALVRALDGSRQWPEGVPFLAFLAGVMRSISDEMWRRRRREAELVVFGGDAEADYRDAACSGADPERVLAASEAITAIYRLFARDAIALQIISGLAGGLTAEDIRTTHGMAPVDYDSARRRMRRALLKAGLFRSPS
jgi:DNA-directed RNA polymerase specialized sigma24 family protein